MFEEKVPVFIYCISPVHMGAGTALGVVDNPIQREVHTGHPVMAGSGLKGAFRDVFAKHKKHGHLVERIFGPSDDGDKYAGAISFTDAQIVLFPVRSLRRSFVYTTCPTALARLRRLLAIAGMDKLVNWHLPENFEVKEDSCLHPEGSKAVANGKLVLEAYEFKATEDQKVGEIAKWLSRKAFPNNKDSYSYFKEKLKSDLVVISDERFNYFVKNATLVEPHVRINDASGTADDGGLFYTENLPPESLLVSLAMASQERGSRSENDKMSAKEVVEKVEDALNGKLVQVGGDATTGRGLVVLRFVEKEGNDA